MPHASAVNAFALETKMVGIEKKLKRFPVLAGLAGVLALAALASTQTQAQTNDTDLLQDLLANPTATRGTVTFPIVFCWYKGLPALYIQTDASNTAIAAQQKVNLVPRLANAIHAPNGGAVDDIYHITNFKQGNVIPSAPIPAGPKNSDPNYTPLWQLTKVTWKAGTTPRVLKSEEEVLGARDDGEVTLEKTNIVLNCPVIYTPEGGKLPLIQIHIEN
jgi:hypothetical protein